MPSKFFYIETRGCQMNFHDSEKIMGILKKEGYFPTDEPRKADLIIFNTCSIRKKPEEKLFSSLGRLKHLKRQRPSLKIAVCGCIAQQKGEELLKRASHVDYIFGPQNISKLPHILTLEKAVITEENPEIQLEELPAERIDGIKASVTVMYGCNNFCSYCVVPYTRGREISRPLEKIINEIKSLADQGYKEIQLLGQNVNSYRDREFDFSDLLRKVNDISGIERIRFITSHPRDLTERLIKTMAELGKICEHLHLPIQSGSNRILNLMNRGYTYEDYKKKVDLLRSYIPNIAITTDIITGFPSETEEDHHQTLRALEDIQYDGIFAFKYSRRPGTKAADMPEQISEDIKSRRLSEILKLQDNITLKKNTGLIGTIQEVLIEGKAETGQTLGRTRTNKIVILKEDLPSGLIIKARITEAKIHSLIAEPL
ncbi:MAG: tRNA (N6-isopentenyl adenosine(37)-C2)-methylthiotransferase MiaB [Thermodesulfovibrionales bacterium]|nr:tRNA (N6-isopentenyl adenosine(37)-C2)-methylthiotransferase MiaB [Thermodesulfovibrionales bacterium]